VGFQFKIKHNYGFKNYALSLSYASLTFFQTKEKKKKESQQPWGGRQGCQGF